MVNRSISNIVRKSPSLIVPRKPFSTECEGPQTDESVSVKSALKMEIIPNDTMNSDYSLQESCEEDSELKFFQEEIILSSDITGLYILYNKFSSKRMI